MKPAAPNAPNPFLLLLILVALGRGPAGRSSSATPPYVGVLFLHAVLRVLRDFVVGYAGISVPPDPVRGRDAW